MPTARITIKTIATVPGFSDDEDDDDESAPTVGVVLMVILAVGICACV